MARFDTAFDATGIEPTTAYEILPAGKYRAQIVESEMRVTKNGMGKYLWARRKPRPIAGRPMSSSRSCLWATTATACRSLASRCSGHSPIPTPPRV